MAYTIARDVCESIDDCVAVCPTECIVPVPRATNRKGTRYVEIQPASCIDCGACLSVCPIEDAVVDAWRPELQGQAPGLPCLRCDTRMDPTRRFCPACGAPVAARCAFEDLALLDEADLTRLIVGLARSPWGAEVAVVGTRGHPALAARIRAAWPDAVAPPPAGPPALAGPSAGDTDAARRAIAIQLRLLVARGQMRYTGQG